MSTTATSERQAAIGAALLQQRIWAGSIPLEIRLAPSECRTYDQADPYLIQCPRLSYLPFLLPRLHAFFRSYLIASDTVQPHDGWFEYEDVPLRWQHPIGLLYDMYAGAEAAQADEHDGISLPATAQRSTSKYRDGEDENISQTSTRAGALPWSLTLHFSDYPSMNLIPLDENFKLMHDSFINSVKEADFLRNGTAKPVMSLSMPDSQQLWDSLQKHDRAAFDQVNQKLLAPPGVELRNVPLRIYLPHAASKSVNVSENPVKGTLKVVQGPVSPGLKSSRKLHAALSSGQHDVDLGQPQTLGTALNVLLPALFPSRRTPLLALPVLHGAVVPLAAPMEELMRSAAYADGWLHLTVSMMS